MSGARCTEKGKRTMKRPSLKAAIKWMAEVDDTGWINGDPATGAGAPSVTAVMTADLFGVDVELVRRRLLAYFSHSLAQKQRYGS
jgi:hypothetical protein